MRFSTTFKLASRKGIVEKIKEVLTHPTGETLDVNVEMSWDISAEELKELYREYRSEVDASNTDVSNFLDQISKIWDAVKNSFHDLLKEIVDTEDDIFNVQNAIHRLMKNARENRSEFRKFSRRLDKEEAAEEAEEKTED